MAVTKLSNSGIKTGVLKYDSMLAGNAAYDPAATWLIQRVAGTGSAGTITFSSIPQTYQHLQIRGIFRDTFASGSIRGANLQIQFNGNTGANYVRHRLYGDGTSAAADGATGLSNILLMSAGVTSAGSNTNTMGAFIIDIHDYASTTKNKTVRAFSGADANVADTNFRVALNSGLFLSTGAITSISLIADSSNISSNSSFALYGFKG